MMYEGLISRYREYLPVTDRTPVISLMEGNTPLIPSLNIGRMLGIDLHFKYEGLNPTGSFKDRGMVLAVAKAMESGSGSIICASTGNTSASAAAYAARFGLKCAVVIPAGNIAYGKLAQAFMYGARVVPIQGNFDKALELVRIISDKYGMTLVNSLNPFRIEGQKTAAFEILEQLGRVPDYLALPVGNAGNITAYWKGFKLFRDIGKAPAAPIMAGFQSEGASPIVQGKKFENPETIATAIRIGNPVSWDNAIKARDESGGFIDSVTDDEILEAYAILAGREGVFAEPASAASLAGIIKSVSSGRVPKGSTVVCVLTGNGLKDPDNAVKLIKTQEDVSADEDEIVKRIMG
ncbi:MAG: threonine synthase [Clostridia bacterium]|nr:threonine synthase [Clostridia bacterium]